MKYVIILAICGLLVPLSSVQAAVGSTGTHLPEQAKMTPEEMAGARYQSGIKHRDKAMILQQEISTAKTEKQKKKLRKKFDRSSKKAIADLNKAIKLSPRHYKAYSSLGYTLQLVGRHDESLAAYDKALQINPHYGDAIENRGEIFLQMNRIEDAKQAYMLLSDEDSPLAGKLLSAMTAWVTLRRHNPDGLEPAVIDRFADWIDNESRS